jgi:TRAP-type C4-dicarboxylate transport system permease large subunit
MIGLLTPPVGVVLYITSSIAKISFEEMSRVTAPYLIPLVIVLLISAFIPAVTMTLPNLLIR